MNIFHRSISTICSLLLPLFVLCFAGNALAQVSLENSIPAANSHLNTTPAELILTFEKPIMLMKISLTDTAGNTIKLNFTMTSELKKTQMLPLPKLSEGHYTVNWTAMVKDGRNVNGSFAFMIGSMKDEAGAMSASSAKATDMKHDDTKDHSGMNMDNMGHAK